MKNANGKEGSFDALARFCNGHPTAANFWHNPTLFRFYDALIFFFHFDF